MTGVAERLRAYERGLARLSPLYSALLVAAADDVDAGGPAGDVLAGHEDDPPGSALSLRFLAAVHRLVLERRAPEVALFFPSVGGTAPTADAWPAVRRLLAAEREAVRGYVDLPCQTNEVGRSAALLAGLLGLVPDRPVRLLEVGASAGLNLRVDAYRYETRFGGWGPAASPVRFDDPWAGRAPDLSRTVQIVERRGCDLAPIDPASAAGRLRLTSQVWADQPERFERLRGALAVAARVPAEVDRADAVDWLAARLAEPTRGRTTVVWHSVVAQYLPPPARAELAAVLAAAGARATDAAPLVHLRMEPEARGPDDVGFPVRGTSWPGGRSVQLGEATGHGPPVRLITA